MAAAAACERQLRWDVRILLPRCDGRLVPYTRQMGLGEVQDLTRSTAKANVIPRKAMMNLGESLQRDNSNFLESPALEMFKTHLDKVLCSLLWVTLLRQGVWTR